MSKSVKIGLTKNIRYPNEYIQALSDSYKNWIFNEEEAPSYKGKWLSVFSTQEQKPTKIKQPNLDLDLEIGTGTGVPFTRLCLEQSNRHFLALEIKYKPLIQTIRRARKNNLKNMRGIRYNAKAIEDLFEKEELNNVYLHFPDPWLKKRRQKKHQLIQPDFCNQLYQIQKPSSFLDFKTDSLDYFESSLEHFKKVGYKIHKLNHNLYEKEKPTLLDNLSQFELIFVKKQHPIKYALVYKS